MTGPREDWDDARLDAAFAARAAAQPPAPPDLIVAVLARVAAAPDPAAGVRKFAPLLGLAAALAIAAVVGVGQLGPLMSSAASSSPHSADAPTASPQGSDAGPALGDAISVVQASAIRNAGVDDREVVVTGFLGGAGLRLACPLQRSPVNPTHLVCPQSFAWLMQDPESLTTTSPDGSGSNHPPVGPAIHPSFALVDQPAGPDPPSGNAPPPRITVVGHFDDRRAALCAPAERAACGDTFVVDRVLAVDGAPRGVVTELRNQRFDEATQKEVTEQPKDLQEDVDRLVLGAIPGGSILSRQLLTIGQVIGVEPVLANDYFVPNVGNPAALMWIVTVVDPSDSAPKARTFALFDGSNWFGEVTAAGMVMIERTASGQPPVGSILPVPSADPTAFDSAPTSVLGIEVRDIATVMHDRQATMDDLGRDELAIRAWYVGPNPAEGCEPAAAPIHPPTPPCDKARHWLLDRPEQYSAETGQLRTKPEHWPPVLNPLLPVDVPFDTAATWDGNNPAPQAVIVLGHFEDNRVDTYAGNVYFVLDALAWTRGRPVGTLDTVTRLTSAATEDPAGVLARIGGVSPNDAIATWTTVVDAADFASLDPRTAQDAPEFTSGAPVWIVRRLIHSEMDGRQRLAVEWAYTADRGSRVWWTERPDSSPDLGTTLDLHDIDARTTLVRVFDYDQQIVSVRDVTPRDQLDWRFTEHKYMALLEVARGRTDREVAIRWRSGACDPEWLVRVNTQLDGSRVFIQPQTFGDYCPGGPVPRSIMLVFDRPIALSAIRTTDEASSGGG